MKRDVVPASRAGRVMGPRRNWPTPPPMVTVVPSRSTSRPSARRQSIIASVSSPSGTSVSTLWPSASAAQTSARLAMLFEPGTSTTASSGAPSGATR